MNAIDELVRELGTLADDDGAPDDVAADYARRRLRQAMADTPPRPRPWLRWRSLVIAAAAVAILAVVTLLPGQEGNAPAPASAAVVLERVARVATQRRADAYPGPHQYLYLKFREGSTNVVVVTDPSKLAFAFRTADTQQDWVAPNGSGRQRYIADGPARFLTPRDQAAWQATGRIPIAPPSSDGTYPAGGYPAGNQIDPRGLPTDPAALRHAIVKRFENGRFTVERTFALAGTLLQDSGSPALRAALYRMVAGLPGVQYLGQKTDALGRRGIAVGLAEVDGVRSELLFNPDTSDVLEEADVQVRPGPIRAIPVGAALHYVAYEGRGVVDSIEALPGGGKVPFHAGRP